MQEGFKVIKMAQINPFCDSDFRSGMQFLSGVNLMITGVSIFVNILAISEISYFFANWIEEDLQQSLHFSPIAAELTLILDIFIASIQLYFGLRLYGSVLQNSYSKIRQWLTPSLLLLGSRITVFGTYCLLMPSSAYFYYFTSISILYSAFMIWPVKRYLVDIGIFPITENTRLLNCANYH